jgi:hypothetical protein
MASIAVEPQLLHLLASVKLREVCASTAAAARFPADGLSPTRKRTLLLQDYLLRLRAICSSPAAALVVVQVGAVVRGVGR